MTSPAFSGAPTAIQTGVLQSPANYSYPITSGLLASLTPQGQTPPQSWSQMAYQMAGSPKQGGMYQSVATPPATAGASSGSSLASLLPLLGGLLGTSAGGSAASSGLSNIAGSLRGLLGLGVPGSAASTGNLGDTPYSPLTGSQLTNIGDFGLSGDPGSQGADLSGLLGGSPDYDLTSGLSGDPANQGADLSGLWGFNSAGGQAATPSPQGSSSPSILGNTAGLLGVGQGLASGSPTGYASAGLGATSLAAKNGLLGASSSTAGQLAGNGLSALGLYQGLQQGGVAGDATAAANAAKLAGSIGSSTGLLSSGVGSALSTAGGYIAAPLALYNLANNWQSGATGSDALQGASAGAAIGSIVPGLGTLIGGLIGGAAGAVSSAFGGGKQDPETQNVYAVNSAGSDVASQLTPAQSFQYLAGVMDAKNNSPGHSTALEQTFGRMGESNVLNGMSGAINSAYAGGKIPANASPTDVYTSVVVPWLTSQGVPADSLTFKDVKGNSSGNNLQQALTNLVGAYMSGSLTSATPIGVSGQADSSLSGYAGLK